MSIKYLPTTGITSMVTNKHVYAYAQVYEGDLCELVGSMRVEEGQPVYGYEKQKFAFAVTRLNGNKVVLNAPKMFTPIAAAPFASRKSSDKNTRFIFYLNDQNILCDAYFSEGESREWQPGELAKSGVVCAHYSKLTAITVANDLHNFVCLYYQAPTEDAAIKMVSLSGETNKWIKDAPDLKDPPLFGTSITAVQPRPEIALLSTTDENAARQPVYYLQMHDLRLGHAQGTSDPVVMGGLQIDGKSLVFSPHTSLTAVDDGTRLYIIYKSNHNNIKMIEIVNNKPNPPETIEFINTTPMSSIAACLSPESRVVLFYQSLNTTTRQVNLFARTLYKASTNSTKWTSSTEVRLGQ
ncbi:hypothetical protein F4804DRAFT_326090 [Jackrogersella minutella]|nr:hypothetical protein F4804DRAFT_326090 [Jackrogersella minutella]